MVVAIVRVAVDNTYDKEINIAWLCFWSFVEVDTGKIIGNTKISYVANGDYQAIIVSCVASLRQLIVTSQNQASSGRTPHQGTTDPILKASKPGLSPTFSESFAYAESPGEEGEKAPLPGNMVRVQNDIEICTRVASHPESGSG